jgi:holin-like protein
VSERPWAAGALGWLVSFTVLVVFQLAGAALVSWLDVPLPGPVVGLALLAVALVAGRRGRHWRRRQVDPAAESLLEILPLLFVPAGVGVIDYFSQLSTVATAVVVALVGSFLLTFLTTGGLLQLLARRRPG